MTARRQDIDNLVKSLDLTSDPVVGPRIRAARQEYAQAFAPVKADLAAVGIHVEAAQELRNRFALDGVRYDAAIPILLHWLSKADLDRVRSDIARTVSMPWARELALPALISQFRIEPQDRVRAAIGNGIGLLACDDFVKDILELALDQKYGTSRSLLVHELGRLTPTRQVKLALAQLLQDPDVRGHAIAPIVKRKLAEFVPQLRALAASDTHASVRRACEKAVMKLTSRPK